MKILVVTNGYFPGKKYGGPPVSINNLCNLMNEVDFFIITKNHDLGDKEKYEDIKDGWNIDNNKKIIYLSDSEYNIKRIEQIIINIKPDFIYLQSLFQSCVVPCLLLSKKYSIKVLLAPRGELCKGAFKKKWKKIPYIYFLRFFKLINKIHIQSTSEEETTMVMKYLKINSSYIHYLTNVPTLIPTNFVNDNKKKKNELKIIYLSRIVPKKNLLFALKCIKNINGNVKFDIYGTIEDNVYWDECQKLIKLLPTNIKINYNGIVDHDKVCMIFSNYDLFFFPTKSENFGHVIVEALNSGCPVLISNQTPFTDLKKYNVGADFCLEDEKKFVDELNNFVKYNNDEWKVKSDASKKYIEEKLKIKEIKKNYTNTFIEIMKGC